MLMYLFTLHTGVLLLVGRLSLEHLFGAALPPNVHASSANLPRTFHAPSMNRPRTVHEPSTNFPRNRRLRELASRLLPHVSSRLLHHVSAALAVLMLAASLRCTSVLFGPSDAGGEYEGIEKEQHPLKEVAEGSLTSVKSFADAEELEGGGGCGGGGGCSGCAAAEAGARSPPGTLSKDAR